MLGSTELTFLLIAASFGFSFLVLLAVRFAVKRGLSPAVEIDDPVQGILEVTSASQPSARAIHQSFEVTGVIHVEGQPAQAVSHSGLVKTDRYPTPGVKLPVTVSASDPTKFRIEWHQVSSDADRGRLVAEELARQINAKQEQKGEDVW